MTRMCFVCLAVEHQTGVNIKFTIESKTWMGGYIIKQMLHTVSYLISQFIPAR